MRDYRKLLSRSLVTSVKLPLVEGENIGNACSSDTPFPKVIYSLISSEILGSFGVDATWTTYMIFKLRFMRIIFKPSKLVSCIYS